MHSLLDWDWSLQMMWAVVGTTPFETYDKLTLTFRHTGTCVAANAKQAFRPAWCADLPVHSLLDWHWSFQMMWAIVGNGNVHGGSVMHIMSIMAWRGAAHRSLCRNLT